MCKHNTLCANQDYNNCVHIGTVRLPVAQGQVVMKSSVCSLLTNNMLFYLCIEIILFEVRLSWYFILLLP